MGNWLTRSPYGRNSMMTGPWNIPTMVKDVPLTLKRVNLTTRVPALMASAVGEYMATPEQERYYLPQRMLFQEHKLSPTSRAPLGAAHSVIAALTPTGSREVVARLAAAQFGLAHGQSMRAQARARYTLPMPNDVPQLWDRPVMGVPQMAARDRVAPPQALQATDGRRQKQAFDRARIVAETKANIANQDLARRAGFRAIVGGR